VQVYSMGIFDTVEFGKHSVEERNGPQLLNTVALETGGREFPVRGMDDLALTGVEIARDLRDQYVLGYTPANPVSDGKYHRVNLKLELPNPQSGLHTYYRRGYYSPSE
jgi:Ca-activated chloride channel family protein